MMENNALNEQIEYYRARAQEYDESIFQTGRFASHYQGESIEDQAGEQDVAMQVLQMMGPFKDILELACGTGIWTKTLLKIGRAITALDASPEMLAINERKVADARVRYQQADLFTWEPEQQYDLVFFANWLSHVPPEALDRFLDKVRRAVLPGGRVVIVDQYAAREEDLLAVREGIYHTRTLSNGRTFTIVKVFYDLSVLKDTMHQLEFEVLVEKFGDAFFFLSGRRKIDTDLPL